MSLVVGAVLYVALVVTFVLAYRLSKWDFRPELPQWKEITASRSEEEIHRWLGDACAEAYEANLPQLSRKGRLVAAILILIAGEAIALTTAVLAPLL